MPKNQQGDEDIVDKLSVALDILTTKTFSCPNEREETARSAVNIIDTIRTKLEGIVTNRRMLDFSHEVLLRIASDASRATFLLTKYHRRQSEQATLPTHKQWERSLREQATSSIDILVQRAGKDTNFADFAYLSMPAAGLFHLIKRQSQAKELLEHVEQRLLKQRHRSDKFRHFVELLIRERDRVGLKPEIGSRPESRVHFEWYASNHGIQDPAYLQQLDSLVGYKRYAMVESRDTLYLVKFLVLVNLVPAALRDDVNAVLFGNYILLAANSIDQLMSFRTAMLSQTDRVGVAFLPTKEPFVKHQLQLMGFEFSAAGVVRL